MGNKIILVSQGLSIFCENLSAMLDILKLRS